MRSVSVSITVPVMLCGVMGLIYSFLANWELLDSYCASGVFSAPMFVVGIMYGCAGIWCMSWSVARIRSHRFVTRDDVSVPEGVPLWYLGACPTNAREGVL